MAAFLVGNPTILLAAAAALLSSALFIYLVNQPRSLPSCRPLRPASLASGAVMLVIWGFLGFLVLKEGIGPAPGTPGELVVEAAGSQCAWAFEYPQSGRRSSELVVPVGRQLKVQLSSLEEGLAFSVPDLNISRKTRRGRPVSFYLTPREVDNYPVWSGEGCKQGGSLPAAWMRVVEPMAFQSWLVQQEASLQPTLSISLVEQGRQLAEASGCLGCHSIDGSSVAGPTLLGLYGRERKLEGGSQILADEEYLRISILEPGRQVAEGYPDIMPAAFTMLSEDEIQAIIAYIASLK